MTTVIDASVAIKWFTFFKPEEATLVTADRRYYDKAGREGRIILLADWAPTGN